MPFDAHVNFGYSLVATPPVPALSGGSLTVGAGEGADFPAVPFNAVVWPAGALPRKTNAEVVRATARVADTFTITRTQESSSARAIVGGDAFADAITAKALTDIETRFPVVNADLVSSAGVLADTPPGRELAYAEITAPVTVNTATEATAVTVVSAGAFTFDGATPVIIEFYAPRVDVGAGVGESVNFAIYDGAATIGFVAGISNPTAAATAKATMYACRRLTPSNASHTYSVRAWRGAANGTVQAGAGGATNYLPAYVRIVKA